MSRFMYIDQTTIRLPPVHGYRTHPLLPLRKALDPIISQIEKLEESIKFAKSECHFPSEHGLTHEESAAIYLYTMEWGEQSLYKVLNATLRDQNRSVLIPWNGYLKLFETALKKLPSLQMNVWRGIKGEVTKKYEENKEETWWYFSSCSSSLKAVKEFLGPVSTLFMIEAKNGKDISAYSSVQKEKEIILSLGTRVKVGDALDHDSMKVIHFRELENDDVEELPSPFLKMNVGAAAQPNFKQQVASANNKSSTVEIKTYPNGDKYDTDHFQTLLVVVPSTVAIIGLIWRTIKRYPSTIIKQSTEENKFLINQCPSFAEYRPTAWIFNRHLMTILGVLFRPLPPISFERIIVTVDHTGGTVALDWHIRPYRRQLFYSKLDLCCVVVHARGCGQSKLTSSKSFCAANTDDVRVSLKYIRSTVGEETPIFAVGYSLGAGILTKFLGEESNQCSLQGAIVCCASFDMHLTTNNLERWFNLRMYNQRLTNNLIQHLRSHEEHFSKSDSQVNLNNAYQSKTVRDFDMHTIVPQYGFRNVEHYYSVASPNQYVKSIRIPTLVLSAIDDPICPIGGLPQDDVLQNPSIIVIKTLEGGHVSYLQGWWPKSFSYDNIVVVDYIKARLKQMNYQWEKQIDVKSIIDTSTQKQ
ncbi:unnamed protein product [Rotaria magnacalcarata]|uniref:NAD(P)(+)--arginine ADP-ribosyltransferase n=2 Tax=Rotaria magnacalcarata TaxID=392030 RepID=A0A816YHZ0_9BILA|nr:unnamed protein product [Rotaria magnacalcarata]